jgi:ABC-2 type transport system permease protein/lipopolysaccharide transport system permease protein
MVRASDSWTENTSTNRSLFPISEIWRARELIGFFALRDLKVRYRQAVLGAVWVVVQPIITVGAFTLAFKRIGNVETFGLPYPIFALAGLLGWTYISQCIARGSEVLVATPALVTKVYIPRLVVPIAALLPGLVDLAVGLGLLTLLAIWYQVTPSLSLLLLPVWLVLLVLTAVGPVLLLAAVNVRYRDVRHIVPPLLQALLFLSPVAYSGAGLDGSSRLIYALNPAVGALEFGRYVLVDGPWPGDQLVVSSVSMIVFAVCGIAYFQRTQRSFADII